MLCRPIGKVAEFASGDSELYATFYQLVEAWGRLPEDNEWDSGRGSVDSLLFPHYHKEIRFAALSITDQGALGYGGLTIVLHEKAIKARATVFDENTMEFCRKKKVIAGSSPPHGYRAVWNDRAKLASAKLGAKITAKTTESDYPHILLTSSVQGPTISSKSISTAPFIASYRQGHREATHEAG